MSLQRERSPSTGATGETFNVDVAEPALSARVVWQEIADCTYKRLLSAFSAWGDWRRDRSCPRWEDVDLYDVPLALLPSTLVLDVVDDGQDYRFRFWGTEISNLFGCDSTGRLLSNVAEEPFLKISQEQYGAIRKFVMPLYVKVLFHELDPSRQSAALDTLLLPVVDTGKSPTKIIAVSEVSRKPYKGTIVGMINNGRRLAPHHDKTTKASSRRSLGVNVISRS